MDVTYGNMTRDEASRLGNAAGWIDDVLHDAGSTEPWVSRLVADFIIARGARTVLETGGFRGATSVYIADALRRLGGGFFWVCEIDPSRGRDIRGRLERFEEAVDCVVIADDVLRFLPQIFNAAKLDLAFVDDCHEKAHVTKELTLLYPKMNPGGLILLHDVFGVCDLRTVVRQFGGYSIDLPRLGPAGGLGIIQVPT